MTWVICDWEVKTHIPAIRAAMGAYAPKFTLELGIGIHSTPVILEYKTKYIGIENSMEWVDIMRDKVTARFIYHQMTGVDIGTSFHELLQEQKDEISDYYKRLELPSDRPNLLFVDSWTCNRSLSINALKDRFDIIIYHDSEGIKEYSYDIIDFKGFNIYTLLSTKTWTGIMIRKKVDKGFELLSKVTSYLITSFTDKYPESKLQLYEGNSN
jgi:hypothetical protein